MLHTTSVGLLILTEQQLKPVFPLYCTKILIAKLLLVINIQAGQMHDVQSYVTNRFDSETAAPVGVKASIVPSGSSYYKP